MGLHINHDSKWNMLSVKNKMQELLKDGAKETDATWKDNLLCVLDMDKGESVAYMRSKKEFENFSKSDYVKAWLVYPPVKIIIAFEEKEKTDREKQLEGALSKEQINERLNNLNKEFIIINKFLQIDNDSGNWIANFRKLSEHTKTQLALLEKEINTLKGILGNDFNTDLTDDDLVLLSKSVTKQHFL